jgi:hypothetical protein
MRLIPAIFRAVIYVVHQSNVSTFAMWWVTSGRLGTMTIPSVTRLMKTSPNVSNRPSVHTQTSFSIQSCGTCYAILYLCQRPLYKILVKVRNSKINVLKIVLIIVNINKEENKSLISNQFSLLKMIPPPPTNHFLKRVLIYEFWLPLWYLQTLHWKRRNIHVKQATTMASIHIVYFSSQ